MSDFLTDEQLDDLKRIVERLDAYYDPHEVVAWIHGRHPQLEDGRTPHDCIKAGETHLVDAILDRLDSGAYL